MTSIWCEKTDEAEQWTKFSNGEVFDIELDKSRTLRVARPLTEEKTYLVIIDPYYTKYFGEGFMRTYYPRYKLSVPLSDNDVASLNSALSGAVNSLKEALDLQYREDNRRLSWQHHCKRLYQIAGKKCQAKWWDVRDKITEFRHRRRNK